MPALRIPSTLLLALTLGAFATLRAQQPTQRELRVAHGRVAYWVQGSGDGPPLVLLSGGPGFSHDYFDMAPAFATLARSRRVVTWDQRGTGKSSTVGPTDTVTVADFVADLDSLRSALGAQKIDVLGHSFGGFLAMAYASAHPDRVAHLLLIDSAAPKFSDTIFLFEQVFPELSGKSAKIGTASRDTTGLGESIRAYFSMIFYDPAKRDAMLAHAGDLVFNPYQFASLQRDMAKLDYTPSLGRFRFPALVVTGRYDMNVAPLTAWRMHKAIPGSEFAVFEKSSHIPFLEEPERFADVLERFLQR